jgi:hypothetical protein
MRALRRLFLAPLVMAAVLSVTPVHLGAAPATHPGVAIVYRGCPAGTNWDNATGTCH